MNITAIIAACLVVGITGLVMGVLLGFAGKVFEVKVDEKEVKVRELLPGSNCGGCGYAGCDAMAEAIAQGNAPVSGCPVGGAAVAEKIAEVMGTEVSVTKQVAFVKCNGNCYAAPVNYEYHGNMSCKEAVYVTGGGPKKCSYGCMGFGSCVQACDFGAISIVEGIAVIDREKCVSCGKCVRECPKHLIEIIPYDSKVHVQCNSKVKGAIVKAACSNGCIGCKLCEKNCKFEAIHVEDNIAHIDYDKCKNCGVCAMKCPTKIISHIKSTTAGDKK